MSDTTHATATQANWTGGSLAAEDEVAFRLELETTAAPGPVSLTAEQRYPGGEVVRWDVPLTVVPGAPEEERSLGVALAVGADGVMMDVHPRPEAALCDGPQAVTTDEVAGLVADIVSVAKAIGRPMADPKQNLSAIGQ